METVDVRVLLMMIGSGDRLCSVVVTDPFLPDFDGEALESLVAVKWSEMIETRSIHPDRVDAVVMGLLGGRTEVVWSAISLERIVLDNAWGDGKAWLRRIFREGFPPSRLAW